MKVVDIPTAAPRDRQRKTMRLLTFAQFPGVAVPGELIELRLPGTTRTIPGVVSYYNGRDGIVGVEPDHQTILAR